ncbi:uncharacterized protein EV154DRAFT_273304 [Mucor mucedo]|uniref:uncharacterized protein n=1 Tax=Mucor mucedo TaxID=29922 RepID=UPI00221EFBD5|nr:uncharacterized protein EV154DRAFT_273304 [Mucor mucedo]KAI7889643.1 hypothetical protein EV154DRAFT_273304 [Mucor mucedo]
MGEKSIIKTREKKQGRTEKEEKKNRRPRTNPKERILITTPKSKSKKNKACFEVGNNNKMPLVIFGDGLKNKDHVKFKGLRRGISNKIYSQLKIRERIGELLLVDINEFKTSKVSRKRTHIIYVLCFQLKSIFHRSATAVSKLAKMTIQKRFIKY